MDPSPDTPTPSTESLPTPRLAECWADLARYLTLYPETNSRVLQSLADFLELLRLRMHDSEAVEIAFAQNVVWVDDDVFEVKATSNLDWLKERLDRAGLSGILLSPKADEESLLAFLRQLLEHYTRKDLDQGFDELWPEPYEGLVLLEKRFEGAFSERGMDDADLMPSIAGRTRRKEETLSNALTRDDNVQTRMKRIQDSLLSMEDEKKDELQKVDLIGSIVDVLPEEALNDYKTARNLTLKVLESVDQQLQKGTLLQALSGLEDDASFRRLLLLIGKTHFHRIDPGQRPERIKLPDPKTEEDQKPVANVVRKGDEKIDDNLESLLEELEELAPHETHFLRVSDLEDQAEQLGVYLHYLVTLSEPQKSPLIEAGLKRLLTAPDNETVGVLREYLEPLCSTDAEHDDLHLGRVAVWLRKRGRRDLLKRCGVLTSEWVCREFPDEFLIYLFTLDLDDARDVAELNTVCGEIGRERFDQAKDLLAGAKDFLEGPLPYQIFSMPYRSTVPFAKLIFERGKKTFKTEFAACLHANAASTVDQKILEVLEGSQFLGSDYLIAIADDDEEKLKEQRLSVLYSFVVSTDGDLSKLEQRVRAIKLLANFDTPHIRAFLTRLVKARKYLILKEQPRPVRQAASDVLRSFKNRGR